jgi:hypothetical protein
LRHLPALKQPYPRNYDLVRTVCGEVLSWDGIIAEGHPSDCPACVGFRKAALYRNRPDDEWFDTVWSTYVAPNVSPEIEGLPLTSVYVDEIARPLSSQTLIDIWDKWQAHKPLSDQ